MIKKIYRGKYPLVISFWAFFFFGTWLAIALFSLVNVVFLTSWGFNLLGWIGPKYSHAVGSGVFWLEVIAYFYVSASGVWKSADAYPLTRWWPNMAKLSVIFIGLVWAGRFYTSFLAPVYLALSQGS